MQSPDSLTLALDAWIIQDGNYPDFERSTDAEFAVEFWPIGPLEIVAPDTRSARHIEGCEYEICGEVVASGEGWWVVDFGLTVYRDSAPRPGAATGSWVRGRVGLGVDPFFYFERLYKVPEIPPLIYTWSIESITMQTAPFVEHTDRTFIRDQANLAWAEIDQTRAWSDDDGHGSYLLTCGRRHSEARRSSRTAVYPTRVLPAIAPIFVFEGHDLNVFDSIDEAATYIEPWDADEGIYVGFDSEGRCLEIASQPVEVASRWTKRTRRQRGTVVRPTNQLNDRDLSRRLWEFIERVGADRFPVTATSPGDKRLPELVGLVSGFVRR